ncbi:MAG: pyruvate:ferredoxin (flavodoxin) oxidoreductase [Myxococcota bacterium]
MSVRFSTLDANEAVASVAYRLSEVIAIYPITPASAMGEHADDWATLKRPNLWGAVPDVIEMQSEGGAAGAVHGALQAGALTTTFTASQGLLLMLPDLFKIAGELTPFCLHVAARALATHALSIFGDHSDVMTARPTGMAMLCSGSPQEAQDLALVAHAATLESRVPFLHFFDGFRTSHQIDKIAVLEDEDLRAMIPPALVEAHRGRALTPDRPVIRGTAQNPDTFFQAREAAEPYYRALPKILEDTFARFQAQTGRNYRLFDYVGHPEADRVLIVMGSAAECAEETALYLNQLGHRVGVIKVRLFRPFSLEHLLAALPRSVRSIAVLDRTKEPGALADPLLAEVEAALLEALQTGRLEALPRVIGGRYGLGSKELTPAMLKAVFDELEQKTPRRRFLVGIEDDITHRSLRYDPSFTTESPEVSRAVFYGLGSDGTVSANKASIKIIGEKTSAWAQGYFEYDSKKSGSTTISYLRFGPKPIRSPYRIEAATFVGIHDPGAIERRDVLAIAAPGATVLLNTSIPKDKLWASFPREFQEQLIKKQLHLWAIDGFAVSEEVGLGRRINTVMQICFFALTKILPMEEVRTVLRQSIEETFGKRGAEVVKRNDLALASALDHLVEIQVPAQATQIRRRAPLVPAAAPDFVQRVTKMMLEGNGDLLPVSAFPPDGTWPTGTARWEKRGIALSIPIWQEDLCVQCNHCIMACPHASLRAKAFAPEAMSGAPTAFRAVPEKYDEALSGQLYSIQVAPEDCTGCGLCVEVCPARDRKQPRRRALVMEPLAEHREVEARSYSFFETIPTPKADALPTDERSVSLRTPLFEFSGACSGCGETPYLRLLTQLFGDRLVIANATGCSSIYGGNLPTTPYTTNAQGRGPAWSNSLFEDNAEFGLGMRLGRDVLHQAALRALSAAAAELPANLVEGLLEAPKPGDEAWFTAQRTRVTELSRLLQGMNSPAAEALRLRANDLVPKSVWIVGGDGWAYDIGYGGLDHVLASHRKVNILVMDTEVYSNTGGQQSKATPIGAAAKFASAGKAVRKKDLGLLAMSYGHIYVAEIGIQARPKQAVQAFLEAEAYPGPSLIIAASPCIAHGYDLVKSPGQQKKAIQSGVWPLYRFDPRRVGSGLSPLMLDSGIPSLDVGAYMETEARFRMVSLRDPERYQALVQAAREGIRERWALYQQLTAVHLPKEDKSHG